jgi:hypothetical protein
VYVCMGVIYPLTIGPFRDLGLGALKYSFAF